MDILYSDFGKRETKSKLSALFLNLSLEEINNTAMRGASGFVLVSADVREETQDRFSPDILRWEGLVNSGRIINTSLRNEPEKVQNALSDAVRQHNYSNGVIVDIRFYYMYSGADVEWPNQHVIVGYDSVARGPTMTQALRWALTK